jgi:hypothetical protein
LCPIQTDNAIVPKTHDRKIKKFPSGAKEIKIGADSRSAADAFRHTVETRHLRGEQWAQYTHPPPQTLYVTVRRDELRQLKDERDQLKQEGAIALRRASSPTGSAFAGTQPALCGTRSFCKLSSTATHEFFTFSW